MPVCEVIKLYKRYAEGGISGSLKEFQLYSVPMNKDVKERKWKIH